MIWENMWNLYWLTTGLFCIYYSVVHTCTQWDVNIKSIIKIFIVDFSYVCFIFLSGSYIYLLNVKQILIGWCSDDVSCALAPFFLDPPPYFWYVSGLTPSIKQDKEKHDYNEWYLKNT